MNDETIECRLCGASAKVRFFRRAADGDDVACYRCTACLSLQTQKPDWLEAAYAASQSGEAPELDTYAAERTLLCRTVVYFLYKIAGFSSQSDKLLDWGGGPGLLTRLLRDVGIDAYNYDKYVRNHFAVGFSRSDEHRYGVVTAFEVFEHFANPSTDLEPIFALKPACLLISTWVYRDQGPEWIYLGPPKSEHVFFYSDEALQLIGRRYGYQVYRLPHEMTVFINRPISKLRLGILHALLANDRLAEIVFAAKKKWSRAYDDHQSIRASMETRS